MPKMLFMGTNDPYWVVDNVKNYLPQIPGYNLLNYTPNAGHGLNDGVVAFPALSAFFGITMAGGSYPECSWKTSENGKRVRLRVKASKDMLAGVKLWYADSKDMDFRDEKWVGRDLKISHRSKIKATEDLPSSGYRAFYIDLKYRDPNGGEYTVSTRVFMTDTKHIL
jgi:PhoPQ-activated pathogenicity-related protein